jgi:membrane peptidoglycan carboxypeptidase
VGNDNNSAMNGVVGGGLPAKIWKSVATYAVNRDAPKVVAPEGDDAVSAAEDPTLLLNPDGTPVEGAVPAEGAPVAPVDGTAPAAPVAPAAPAAPAPVVIAPAADRPSN